MRAVSPVDADERVAALGIVQSGEHVHASTCKLADDGSGDLILRWWAPTQVPNGGSVTARLACAVPVESVLRARLDETTLGPATFADGSGAWKLKPGGILTVRVRLAR